MNKRLIQILLIIFFLTSSIPIRVSADDLTTFELIPNSMTANFGDTITVSVYVNTNTSVNGVEITELTYTDNLNLLPGADGNVTKGNLFSGVTELLWLGGTDTGSTLEEVSKVVTPATDDEGYFCNISFEVIGTGTAYVNLTSVLVSYDIYPYECNVTSNCTIEINESHILSINDTTDITTTSLKVNAYLEDVGSGSYSCGILFDNSSHADTDDFANNYTIGTYSSNTSFYKTVSGPNVEPGTYYYAKAWVNLVSAFYFTEYEYILSRPYQPENLQVTETGNTYANLTWDKTTDVGTNTTVKTVLRYSKTSYPTSLLEGTEGYNGTAESCQITGLDPNEKYYISAFSFINCTGSPNLTMSSSGYASTTAVTYNLSFNFTIRYENRTYLPVDLTLGKYHKMVIHYRSGGTDYIIFNETGELSSSDVAGNFDHVSDGWFNATLTGVPSFFEFHWNDTATYQNATGNDTSMKFRCSRMIVPELNEQNITFFILVDYPIYGEWTYYKNDSLVRYTYSFVDQISILSEENVHAYFYKYDTEGNQLIIHSEYISASRTVFPMLLYGDQYFVGVSSDETTVELGNAETGDSQTVTLFIMYEYEQTYDFYDLINIDIGWTDIGFYVEYYDTTQSTYNVTFYVYGFYNNTLLSSEIRYASSWNFSYTCNTSLPYRWNIVAVIDDDDDIYDGTYSASGSEHITLLPGYEHILINRSRINELLELLFGQSPMYDNDGNEVEWTYIGLFSFSFLLLVSFGKLNAFIGTLSVGLFLTIAGAYIGDLTGTILIGIFLLGLSIIGLLGGVDRK